MSKKYIFITSVLVLVTIVAGVMGVIHEVRSSHETLPQETVIQDIQEQTGTSHTNEAKSTITEYASDYSDNSENEVAIIGPDGEAVMIETEFDDRGTTDEKQKSELETVMSGQNRVKQVEKPISEEVTEDLGTTWTDTGLTSLEKQETVSSEVNSEETLDENQVYETIKLPVK